MIKCIRTPCGSRKGSTGPVDSQQDPVDFLLKTRHLLQNQNPKPEMSENVYNQQKMIGKS